MILSLKGAQTDPIMKELGGDIGFDVGGKTSGACRERQRLS